jgi:preprotein translocase subunit SecA
MLLQTVRNEVTKLLMSVRIKSAEEVENISQEQPRISKVSYNQGGDLGSAEAKKNGNGKMDTFVRSKQKIGRNDPCWCGSGKKYKHCHGRLG